MPEPTFNPPFRPQGQEQSFRMPQDFEAYNCLPFPVSIMDFQPGRKQCLWANTAYLDMMETRTLEELRARDLSKVSEGVARTHEEYFQTCQVQGKHHGPTRKTIFPRGCSHTMDLTMVPIPVLMPEADKAKVMSMMLLVPYREETSAEALCGFFMVERVSSMAMLFERENGTLIQANSMARAHYRKLTGRADGKVDLREVLEGFEWEDESELETTAAKIQELDLGHGAVVFERAVKSPKSEQGRESSTEVWHKVKFEGVNDPRTGSSQRAILVSGQDVSEQRSAQSDLLRMNHNQERLFAECAHELRTPLHCISGLAESTEADPACPRGMKKSLSIIQSQARRLAAMVSDIVDSAADQRNTLLIKHESIALHSVAESVRETMATLAKKGVRIVNAVPDSLPVIQADSSRLFQVLVNLVANSIRFTAKGHVTISAEPDDGVAVPSVRLRVSDSGLGIPADKIGGIFESFQQVDAATTRKYGGTGLGLALVKTLVGAHHGTVTVESVHGGSKSGTTFTITLPVRQPDARRRSGEFGAELAEMTPHESHKNAAAAEEEDGGGSERNDHSEAAVASVSSRDHDRVPKGPEQVATESLEQQLRVLDHVALPCWIIELCGTPGPSMVWANAVTAQLWGRKQSEMTGSHALDGPLKAASRLVEAYQRLQVTEVVREWCQFEGGRECWCDITVCRLSWQRGDGTFADWLLHVGVPCPR